MKGWKIDTQLAGENDFLLPFLQNLADEAQDVDPRAVRRRHLAERKRRHRERAEARRTAQKSIMSSSDLPRCLSPSMLDHQPMSPARSPTPLDQPQIKPKLSYPSPATSNLDHIKLESPSPTIKQSSPAFFDFDTAFSEISDTELIEVQTIFEASQAATNLDASQSAEPSSLMFDGCILRYLRYGAHPSIAGRRDTVAHLRRLVLRHIRYGAHRSIAGRRDTVAHLRRLVLRHIRYGAHRSIPSRRNIRIYIQRLNLRCRLDRPSKFVPDRGADPAIDIFSSRYSHRFSTDGTQSIALHALL
jgi:hypothetical protein